MWQWLRRSFIAGFFITVPLVVSIIALVWVFRFADRLTGDLPERFLGMHIPGVGFLATALILLAIGSLAANVLGRRLVQKAESLLLQVPVLRTIYGPLKQLIAAFSPDNERGFKRVVLVGEGSSARLGFVTREFEVDRGRGPEPFLAVYVPTNNLYLGDMVMCRREDAPLVNLTVEQAVRALLTGGVALPSRIKGSTTLPGPEL